MQRCIQKYQDLSVCTKYLSEDWHALNFPAVVWESVTCHVCACYLCLLIHKYVYEQTMKSSICQMHTKEHTMFPSLMNGLL